MLLASWICLVLPIGGLVYMTRFWLFGASSEMPWIALTMIWLMLLSYCSFGIVPTVIYIMRNRDAILVLPWVLDVLNILSKLPVPFLVLIAFSTRPAGFHPCS